MNNYPVNTTGILCKSKILAIGWPDPPEYDKITELRNRGNTRKWFFDTQEVSSIENRIWIESGCNRPKESILSIRLIKDNTFLGTVGWTNWDLEMRTANFGRLAVDLSKIKQLVSLFPPDYPGVAIDACLTMRDFGMTTMQLNTIITFLKADNFMAKKVNESIGMKEVRRYNKAGSDGIPVETIEMRLTRKEWESNFKKIKI